MKYNESMLKYFSVIHRRAMMHLDRELKGFNIRAGQVPILRILDEEDGITQDQIKQQLHMNKGALARTIKPLITFGYIVRRRSKVDRRAYSISLTQKGKKIMPHLSAIIAKWIKTLTQGLTPAEQQTARQLLEKMSRNAFAYFEQNDHNKTIQ